jgi:hypothetical protein
LFDLVVAKGCWVGFAFGENAIWMYPQTIKCSGLEQRKNSKFRNSLMQTGSPGVKTRNNALIEKNLLA